MLPLLTPAPFPSTVETVLMCLVVVASTGLTYAERTGRPQLAHVLATVDVLALFVLTVNLYSRFRL